jgi:hypothetical protein
MAGAGVGVVGGAAAPPPQGWLSGIAPPGTRPPGTPFSPSSTASAPADLGNGYRQRSQEEIQRAYDSAAGPPAKPDLDAPPAPAAPPAAPAAPPAPPAAPAAPPAEGAGNSGASEELDLPAAPRLGGPAAPSGGDSEFDELQKRFDALKRQ